LIDNHQASVNVWRARARHIKKVFVNLIFPPVCASCRSEGALLCHNCRAQIPRINGEICIHCGRLAAATQPVCLACRKQAIPLSQIRAALLFAPPVPDLIHQLKYKGAFGLAEPLAELMVDCWPRWQTAVDLILPIPLHPDRQKRRGYNQSDLLVRHFAQQLGIPGDAAALRRVRNTPPQVGLSATERVENMVDAFQAENGRVAGKRILLVDDVCTTGATLTEAAQALLAAGAESVSAYCLARAT